MTTPDLYEKKSKHFLPREIYFWVLNTLGWFITLSLMNPAVDLFKATDHQRFKLMVLSVIWFAYALLGTLTLLVFRHFYYRQRWYLKKFIGSAPLAIAIALGGGFAMAALIVYPMDLLLGGKFIVYNEAGNVVYGGVIPAMLNAALELASILLVWLFIYLGIEGAVNARSLVLKTLALESSLKDARLNALAGQINPHFLFNALNNIRFMIQRDAVRAEESLVDLAEILRHSLGSSQQEKALLAQEIVIVERYLSLMKIHMQRRLDYSIEAEHVPENVLIPPMMIQMLVENAIKHGVEQIKEGGRVDIRCSMMAGKLCIEVKNSTASADSSTGSIGSATSAESSAGSGLGLANISNRLSLLYGDNAQLSMVQQDNDFLVRIELPAEEAA